MDIEVKSSKHLKDWTNPEGKAVPIYEVELTDGRKGQSFANDIPTGTPAADLSITEGQYGLKFKLNKPAKNGFQMMKQQRGGNESFALSYAKDYACAFIASGKDFKSEHVIQLADKFYDWLESKNKL